MLCCQRRQCRALAVKRRCYARKRLLLKTQDIHSLAVGGALLLLLPLPSDL